MSSDMIKIKRGLDIPLAGAPSGEVDAAVTTRAAGLLGADYHGMKPTMAVQVGDVVKRGDLLFSDKKCEGVRYTSPAGGRVSAINRGAKRAFQSVVVEIDGDEAASFDQYAADAARELPAEAYQESADSIRPMDCSESEALWSRCGPCDEPCRTVYYRNRYASPRAGSAAGDCA
jgi:Na(+)-translocating NADH:ubiquinone oxidoreductase A subunit